MIIELALSGRLSSPDSADEPPLVLLERIRMRNLSVQSQARGRASDATAPKYSAPGHWAWTRLGDVIILLSGQHLTPMEYSAYSPGGLPYITGPADFGPNGLIITRQALVRKAVAMRGQILLTVKGAGVGKTALCDAAEVAISRQLMALEPIEWSTGYLLLITQRLAEQLKISARSLIPGISREDVAGFFVALPSLEEQDRIVATVDELMALCDELEAAQIDREERRDRLRQTALRNLVSDESAVSARFFLRHSPRMITKPEHVAGVRQAILDLAVQGRLVPQDPTDELMVIPAATVESSHGRPRSWKDFPLGDLLAEDSRNGYSRRPDGAADGTPILKISAATTRRDGIINEVEHRLVSGVAPGDQERLRLRPGDLLACRFNGNRDSVGILALFVNSLGIEPIFPDKLIRLRPDPSLALPELLRWWSRSTVIRHRTNEYRATTVGNWGISAADLKLVVYPIPPLPEQHRIVAKVDELMAVCDELEQSLCATQTERVRLLEALLHDALADGAAPQGAALAAANQTERAMMVTVP